MMGETLGGQDGCGLKDGDALSGLKLVDVLNASVVTGMGIVVQRLAISIIHMCSSIQSE